MAPHSSSLAWKIPWTEEPGSLQSMGSQRVGHDWATTFFLFFLSFNLTKWMGSHYKILVIPQSACLSPSAGPSVAGCPPVADRCCTFRIKSMQNWKGALVSQWPQVFCSASLHLPLYALPNDTDDGEDWSTSLRCYQLGGCALWGSCHLPACVCPGKVGLLKK